MSGFIFLKGELIRLTALTHYSFSNAQPGFTADGIKEPATLPLAMQQTIAHFY
jgi:hypothetical protein